MAFSYKMLNFPCRSYWRESLQNSFVKSSRSVQCLPVQDSRPAALGLKGKKEKKVSKEKACHALSFIPLMGDVQGTEEP